jgi:Ca-activated chloride channel family protein
MVSYETSEETKHGELILRSSSGADFRAILMNTEVTIDVSGLTASTVVTQSFQNNSTQWMEGRYQFPLPEQAAVHHMVMQVGDRRIIGKIRKKQEAQQIYQAAKRQGKRASLVSQQRPNLFSNNIANIGPGENITIELQYVETIRYDHGEFSIRFPTTVTPRYHPATQSQTVQPQNKTPTATTHPTKNVIKKRQHHEQPAHTQQTETGETPIQKPMSVNAQSGWHSDAAQAPATVAFSPISQYAWVPSHQAPKLTLSARIDAGFPLQYVHSLYQPITQNQVEGVYEITFQHHTEPMNRDIVLRWKPALPNPVNAAVFKETVDDNDYHLIMLLPKQGSTQTQRLPKEVIFVIDTSGSMSGVSIRQAKAALLAGLNRLHTSDHFNIIHFSDSADKLFPTAVNVNQSTLSRANTYLKHLDASGGTNIAQALSLSLQDQTEQKHVRQVIFITDGSVSNEAALFRQIHQDLGNSRLFTVGIGSAPNSHFMRDAANIGKGSFTHIGRINEVEMEMDKLFAKLEHPVLTGIDLNWGDKSPEMFPQAIPDLYLSEPLLLYVKSPTNSLAQPLLATGALADRAWQKSLSLQTHKQQEGIAKQWARQKIAALQSPRHQDSQENKAQAITELALEHQLLSQYTSFIAVEEVIVRPKEASQTSAALPNAMPRGNTMAMPNTATPSLWYFCLGLFSMLLACLQAVSLRRAS